MFEFREARRPYPGLRPFEVYEAEIFFGREEHTDKLLEILQRERFLAVIGPSASGKSSLVRAGLLPGLAMGSLGTGSDWRIALLRPGNRPLRSLAQALMRTEALGRELLGDAKIPLDRHDITAEVATVDAELRRGPLALLHLVQAAHERRPPAVAPFNLLILVDQFEELFAYTESGAEQADESEMLVNLLLAARQELTAGVHIVLTMRSDFLGECVRFQGLPEAINRVQYLTPRLTRQQMESAIAGPARVFGGELRAELVAELINGIGQNSDQLPILQHALARMWQVAVERSPQAPVIGWTTSRAVGGVQKALNQHGDAVLVGMDLAEQRLAEAMFRAITRRRQSDSGQQDVRRPSRLGGIAESAGQDWRDFMPIVQTFADPDVCFIQTRGEYGPDCVVDLSHEALIRQWTQLQTWVADEAWRAAEYHRVLDRALAYADGESNLLSGTELARAADWWNPRPSEKRPWQPSAAWASRYARIVGADERSPGRGLPEFQFESTISFIRASLEEQRRLTDEKAAREQRELEAQSERVRFAEERASLSREEARRARRQSVYLAFGAVAAAAAAVFALYFKNAAEKASGEATVRRLAANSLAIVSSYGRGSDLDAMRIALAADRLDPQDAVLFSLRAVLNGSASLLYAMELPQGIQSVAYSADRSRILSAGGDGRLRIWDARNGNFVAEPLPERVSPVSSMAYSPDGLRIIAGSVDGMLTMRDARSGAVIGKPWKGHNGRVSIVAYSPDGSTLASASVDDHRLRLWDSRTGEPIGLPPEGDDGAVSSVSYSPDGRSIVSGGRDGRLRLWSVRSGAAIGLPMEGHVGPVSSVAYSPDGHFVVSGGDDGQLIRWDVRRGTSVEKINRAHLGSVSCVAYRADGLEIVSGGTDGRLRQWDVKGSRMLGHDQALVEHAGSFRSVAYSADGSRIYSYGRDGTLRFWDASKGERGGRLLKGHVGKVWSATYSPDGLRLASGGDDGTIRLWDAKTGRPIGDVLTDQEGVVFSVAYSPDGLRIASAGSDGTVRLRDGRSGRSIAPPMRGHLDAVWSVAFSPDGQRLVSAGRDGTLRQWDGRTGVSVGAPLRGHAGEASSAAYSPDGSRIVSAGVDGTVRLWDSQTSRAIGPPMKAVEPVQHVAYSGDGRRIVSAGDNGVLRQWDAASGKPIGEPLKGHEGSITGASYSIDGKTIVSSGEDGTVRLWNTVSGDPIAEFKGHTGAVLSASYSADGLSIVSSGDDGTLRQWSTPQAWPALICAKLGRNFTKNEWRRHIGPNSAYAKQCPELPIPEVAEERQERLG